MIVIGWLGKDCALAIVEHAINVKAAIVAFFNWTPPKGLLSLMT
jgi:hypothetical protein